MNKKEIVIAQLEQLGLVKDKDFIIYVMEPNFYTKVSKVLISIKISKDLIDQTAHEFGSNGTLTNSQIPIFVKAQFDINKKDKFNAFDGIRKQSIIEEFLGREINFYFFLGAEIIEAHYPLHSG